MNGFHYFLRIGGVAVEVEISENFLELRNCIEKLVSHFNDRQFNVFLSEELSNWKVTLILFQVVISIQIVAEALAMRRGIAYDKNIFFRLMFSWPTELSSCFKTFYHGFGHISSSNALYRFYFMLYFFFVVFEIDGFNKRIFIIIWIGYKGELKFDSVWLFAGAFID